MNFKYILLIIFIVFFVGGCVSQKLHITSQPIGAEVYFDGEPKGSTPIEFPFKWYGKHKVSLVKSGYQNYEEIIELKAPLYQKIPLDFFSALWPTKIRDQKNFHFALKPKATEEKKQP